MKKLRLFTFISCAILFSMTSCLDNNNKNNNTEDLHESDNGNDAPTYNKTREEMEADSAQTPLPQKRVPKDSVEIITKGNASSE
ncbi:hypothetical protein HYN59_16405 [Flavobacterium album]|uniref:Uncharacterized protein n=1 Tax=Flavobacterium album TaxID=2175091 RepID=A0A2S1R1V2_9FLAO|nr:hypothetical protein [Flavobacterium album]AWH86592.1 hypothetical protein HYN59_16405 [Flavobacterium album]